MELPKPGPTSGMPPLEAAAQKDKLSTKTPSSPPTPELSEAAAEHAVTKTGDGKYVIRVEGDYRSYQVSKDKAGKPQIMVSYTVPDPVDPAKVVKVLRPATLEETRRLEKAVNYQMPNQTFKNGETERAEIRGIVREYRQDLVQEHRKGKAAPKLNFVD